MNTPILTQEQRRKTLSAKKGSIKGLRNVLAQPYPHFWPVLRDSKGKSLEGILKTLLLPLKQSKTSIPWSQLRKLKKEERSALKRKNQEENYDSSLKSSVVTGINAVTRGLEKKNLCAVILDSNVEPIMTKHLVLMAENENVPVILVPFLKTVTFETIGFESAAFALKNDVKNSQNHHFFPLYESISSLSINFERPRTPVKLFSKISEIEEKIEINSDDFIKQKEKQIKVSTTISDIYLYRSSTKERVFVPVESDQHRLKSSSENSQFLHLECTESSDKTNLNPSKNDSNDKLSRCGQSEAKNHSVTLSGSKDNYENSEIVKGSANFRYFSLKVKRMQGNPNRTKATKSAKRKKT